MVDYLPLTVFGIPPDVADATLGDIGADDAVRILKSVSTAPCYKSKLSPLTCVPPPIQIPDTFTLGTQNCLNKAQRDHQPEDQQQLPKAGYSLGSPDDSTGDDEDNSEEISHNPVSNYGSLDHNLKPSYNMESGNRQIYEKRDGWGDQGQGPNGEDHNQGTNGQQNQGTNDQQNQGTNYQGQDQGTGDQNQETNGDQDQNLWEPDNDDTWKRSDAAEDRATFTSAISTDVQTLKELVFFLKLILCALLSGYVFILAYFTVPIWRNRRLQVQLRTCTFISPSVPAQYSKV